MQVGTESWMVNLDKLQGSWKAGKSRSCQLKKEPKPFSNQTQKWVCRAPLPLKSLLQIQTVVKRMHTHRRCIMSWTEKQKGNSFEKGVLMGCVILKPKTGYTSKAKCLTMVKSAEENFQLWVPDGASDNEVTNGNKCGRHAVVYRPGWGELPLNR